MCLYSQRGLRKLEKILNFLAQCLQLSQEHLRSRKRRDSLNLVNDKGLGPRHLISVFIALSASF